MTSNQRIVAIGAGLAAIQLADSLRQEGFDGDILLIGDEPYKPYQRPPLSKNFLAGEMSEDDLQMRPETFYASNRIEVGLNKHAQAIDRATKTVRLSSGEKIRYDKLAITTGTRARKIPVPGAELKGVLYSRGIDDILQMREFLDSSEQIAVVGAGFIGLETAAVLRKMGKEITVLEMQDRVMPRVVAPLVSEFFQKEHEAHGVIVRTGVTVAGFEGDKHGRLTAVLLGDGTKIPAQMAVVGIGVIPNSELAQEAGLVCDNGICVDEYSRTSDPDIVAAGDVASHPNALLGGRVRLESIHNALEQAKAAAATLCGKQKVYEQYPWFWSDQYDLKLQMVGLSQDYDSIVIRGDMAERKFSIFYFKGKKLLAVDSVNQSADHKQARRILNGRIAITPEQAGDPNCDLATLA